MEGAGCDRRPCCLVSFSCGAPGVQRATVSCPVLVTCDAGSLGGGTVGGCLVRLVILRDSAHKHPDQGSGKPAWRAPSDLRGHATLKESPLPPSPGVCGTR